MEQCKCAKAFSSRNTAQRNVKLKVKVENEGRKQNGKESPF